VAILSRFAIVLPSRRTRGTAGYWGYINYYPGNSPAVTVLLGNGNGTFTTGNSYDLPSSYMTPPSAYGPPSLATADLNGDGTLDLVVTDARYSEVDVLLNNGNATFTGPTYFSSETGGYGNGVLNREAVALADLNGDGRPDISVGNADTNTVIVLPNTGDGNFGNPCTFSVGSSPASVAAGDFNHEA
jgi:hypothetical protein